MNSRTSDEAGRLPLSWLFLPWLGFLLTQLVIGTIAALGQGDPYRIVVGWGFFPDFVTFAIVLYVTGNCVAVAVLHFLLRRKGLAWSSVGLRGALSWEGAGLALAGVVAASVLYLAVDFLAGAVGIPMFWYEDTRSFEQMATPRGILLIGLFAVLLGPFVEEVIFRGFVLTALLGRGLRPWSAVTLSAVIFMSVHVFYGPGVLAFIFLLAFIPAFLYLRTGSLHSAIVFHWVNNLIAFVVVPLWL